MKFFAITTFIILLVTAIFLTNSYLTVDQESPSIEKTSDFSETEEDGDRARDGENQDLFSEEKLENDEELLKYQDEKDESLENRHGIPSEFDKLNTEEKITDFYSEQSLTSQAIKETFTEKFQSLETTATVEITNIVELAIDEFKSKKQNGENISYFYFYQTYYPKVTALQTEIDAAFEKKYTELQNELEKNGFSADNAEEFKQEYEIKKKHQLQQMMLMVVGE